jgi:hypothetical protein
LLRTPKSAGPAVTAVIVSVASPVFVIVTVWGSPLVATYWLGKMTLDGAGTRTGATGVLPATSIVCGLPGPLSLTVTFALGLPCAVGVSVTLIWQLALGARLAPHMLVVAKSAAFVPLVPMLEIVNVALPVLVRVTVCGGLVLPTACSPSCWKKQVGADVSRQTSRSHSAHS